MKNKILLAIILGITSATGTQTVIAKEKHVSSAKTIRRCLWHTIKIGAGLSTCAIGLPLCSIGLLGMGLRPLATQKPHLLYEFDAQSQTQQSIGNARHLCDFIVFLETDEQNNTSVPMFQAEDILKPSPIGPISNDNFETIDTISSGIRKTGFIFGLPMVIGGMSAIYSGIKGLATELKQAKTQKAAA